jgi:hypothetical protein
VGKPPARAPAPGIEEVYPHGPKSLLRGGAWKPEQRLPADDEVLAALRLELGHRAQATGRTYNCAFHFSCHRGVRMIRIGNAFSHFSEAGRSVGH